MSKYQQKKLPTTITYLQVAAAAGTPAPFDSRSYLYWNSVDGACITACFPSGTRAREGG